MGLFWSVFTRILTEYWEMQNISQYAVQMQENTDQNISEYRHFSRSANAHFLRQVSLVASDITFRKLLLVFAVNFFLFFIF